MWVSHYGSSALIEGTRDASFHELVPRLAPWMLLEAARRRGGDPVEVRLAGEIFGQTLMSSDMHELDPGADLSVDLARKKEIPFSYSVQLRHSENQAERFKLAFDVDARLQALRFAIDTAACHIREARRLGAKLYLAVFSVDEFVPVIHIAPDIVKRWLEGCSELTGEFRRRVSFSGRCLLGPL